MTYVHSQNVKAFRKDNALRCKCGSVRYSVVVYEDDNNDRDWVFISCKNCGKDLFYNGG